MQGLKQAYSWVCPHFSWFNGKEPLLAGGMYLPGQIYFLKMKMWSWYWAKQRESKLCISSVAGGPSVPLLRCLVCQDRLEPGGKVLEHRFPWVPTSTDSRAKGIADSTVPFLDRKKPTVPRNNWLFTFSASHPAFWQPGLCIAEALWTVMWLYSHLILSYFILPLQRKGAGVQFVARIVEA